MIWLILSSWLHLLLEEVSRVAISVASVWVSVATIPAIIGIPTVETATEEWASEATKAKTATKTSTTETSTTETTTKELGTNHGAA